MTNSNGSAPFVFDDALSSEENITRFLTHLNSVDGEMAKILEANRGLLPFPEGADRSAVRLKFNRDVLAALDALTPPSAASV